MTTHNLKNIMQQAREIAAEINVMRAKDHKPKGMVKRLVFLMEKSGLSCNKFSHEIGISQSSMYRWSKEHQGAVVMSDETRAIRGKSENVVEMASPVQMWRASDGTLHGSPAEARRVSLGWATMDAAKRLWSSLTQSSMESAFEMTSGSADLVLDLADAIRAERAHSA